MWLCGLLLLSCWAARLTFAVQYRTSSILVALLTWRLTLELALLLHTPHSPSITVLGISAVSHIRCQHVCPATVVPY